MSYACVCLFSLFSIMLAMLDVSFYCAHPQFDVNQVISISRLMRKIETEFSLHLWFFFTDNASLMEFIYFLLNYNLHARWSYHR